MSNILFPIFFFTLPLRGILSSILGFNFFGIFTILVIFITRIKEKKEININRNILLLINLYILFLIPHSFFNENGLSVLFNFLYYLILLITLSSLKIKETLEIFSRWYLFGILTLSSIYIIHLLFGIQNNLIIDSSNFSNLSGFGNPNGSAPAYLLGFCCLDLYHKNKPLNKYLYILIFSFLFIPIFFTFSRAIFLSLFTYIIISKLSINKIFLNLKNLINFIKNKTLLTIFPLFLILTIYLTLNLDLLFSEKYKSFFQDKLDSAEIRVEILTNFIEYIPKVGITGIGLDNSRKIQKEASGVSITTHNTFLNIFIELGLFPFIIFILITIRTIIINKSLPLQLKSFIKPLYGYLLGMYIFFLLHDSYINSSFWLAYFIHSIFCDEGNSFYKIDNSK